MQICGHNVIPVETGTRKSDNSVDSRLRGNDTRSCSVVRELRIVPGGLDDYKQLAHFHYRDRKLGPYAAIFALKPSGTLAVRLGKRAAGVIVYTMPAAGLELRNAALGNLFSGFDRRMRLALINRNIRCIGRVIVEPRFRGLGLAVRMVRETMPKMDVAIIEAMAVMGLVNPFFERAGMTGYRAGLAAAAVRLAEAFSMVGIEKEQLIDPQEMQRKLDQLVGDEAKFIELEIRRFLQSYGKRRYMQPCLERTRFVLSKLGARPVYYIWFNKNVELRI